MKHRIRIILLFFLFSIPLTGCQFINDLFQDQNPFQRKSEIERVLDQVVATAEKARQSNIYIETTLRYRVWGVFERVQGGLGSGFVYKKDEDYYYALTNKHVIDSKDADEVSYMVRLNSGLEVEGDVIATSDTYDLAVIRFPISDEDIPLTVINPDKSISDNMFVLVVGNPSGLQNVVTPTKIIDYGPFLKDVDYPVIVLIYDMDAQGNSGGPSLIDMAS